MHVAVNLLINVFQFKTLKKLSVCLELISESVFELTQGVR